MYNQAQSVLTDLAIVMEVGFALWFMIAFPLYCWKKAGESLMQKAAEMEGSNQAATAVEVMPTATTQKEGSNRKKPEASKAKGNEGEKSGLKDQVTSAIDQPSERVTLDLSSVEFLTTPTKVAVKVEDIPDNVQVPRSVRRKRVKGIESFYIRDLSRVFDVVLPQGMNLEGCAETAEVTG